MLSLVSINCIYHIPLIKTLAFYTWVWVVFVAALMGVLGCRLVWAVGMGSHSGGVGDVKVYHLWPDHNFYKHSPQVKTIFCYCLLFVQNDLDKHVLILRSFAFQFKICCYLAYSKLLSSMCGCSPSWPSEQSITSACNSGSILREFKWRWSGRQATTLPLLFALCFLTTHCSRWDITRIYCPYEWPILWGCVIARG